MVVCENSSRVRYTYQRLPGGYRVKLSGLDSGPGTKLSGRFGLGYGKKVPVRFRVKKSAPAQYSTLIHFNNRTISSLSLRITTHSLFLQRKPSNNSPIFMKNSHLILSNKHSSNFIRTARLKLHKITLKHSAELRFHTVNSTSRTMVKTSIFCSFFTRTASATFPKIIQ